MKILYIDIGTRGHNLVYLTNLIKDSKAEPILAIPEKQPQLSCKQYCFKTIEGKKRSFRIYRKWMKEILIYVKKEKPDIIHFLSGDVFYRFLGYGLYYFKKIKTVVTLHWIRPGKLEQFAIKCIAKHSTSIVVHSSYLKQQLEQNRIKNVTHIEYPQFNQIQYNHEESCQYWKLSPKIKTLACIGSTRYDKGIDLLMAALKNITSPFQLLVAGQVNKFTEDDLRTMSETFSDQVSLNIHYLSDEELAMALSAADIIALPYRRSFNGASGPLGEGVAYGKCIIGSNHGNLGDTIQKNHLGYTFESENVEDLTKTIETALSEPFVCDDAYVNYQKSLDPELFREKYAKLYKSVMEDNHCFQ